MIEHAAPLLREELIRAVANAHAARTQRDRQAAFRQAYAYGKALEVLTDAADTAEQARTPGIGQPGYSGPMPQGGVAVTREYLGATLADKVGIIEAPSP